MCSVRGGKGVGIGGEAMKEVDWNLEAATVKVQAVCDAAALKGAGESAKLQRPKEMHAAQGGAPPQNQHQFKKNTPSQNAHISSSKVFPKTAIWEIETNM